MKKLHPVERVLDKFYGVPEVTRDVRRLVRELAEIGAQAANDAGTAYMRPDEVMNAILGPLAKRREDNTDAR